MKHGTGSGLTGAPFAGLGFDLAPTAARARGLTLRTWPAAPARSAPVGRPESGSGWQAHGYGLLLRICRETGGR